MLAAAAAASARALPSDLRPALLPPLQEIARLSISAAGLPGAIERQAAAAVDEAAALIFVVDGQVGCCQ